MLQVLVCVALFLFNASKGQMSMLGMPYGCGQFQFINASLNTKNMPSMIASAISETEQYLNYLVTTTGTPSLSYGIVYDNKLIYYKSFGLTDLQNTSSKPTEQSIYRIGSISKVFTILMSYIMRDQNMIGSFDDPIHKYNSQFAINNPWGITNAEKLGQTLTIKQLASQISGLPREVPCIGLTPCNLTTDQVFERLKHMYLIHPTDVQASYSNLAYAILGNVLSEYVNKNNNDDNPYETLLADLITKPMGLDMTGEYLSAQQKAYASNGYAPPNYTKQEYIDIGWVSPAGQLFSSVSDLSKLIIQYFQAYPSRFQLDLTDASEFNFVTNPQTLREMLRPVFVNPDQQGGFGSPWEMQMLNGHFLRGKGGNINGFSSDIQMIPEMRLGVISLANYELDASVFGLGTLEILMPAFKSFLNTVQSQYQDNLPTNVGDFVGDYLDGPGSNVVIVSVYIDERTSNLMLYSAIQGMYGMLQWMGNDVIQGNSFVFDDLYDHTESCWIRTLDGVDSTQINFQTNQNGVVTGLALPDDSYGVVLPKKADATTSEFRSKKNCGERCGNDVRKKKAVRLGVKNLV